MKEWIYMLWTTKSAFVRFIRLLFAGIGAAIMTGQIPWPVWVGVVLSLVGAAITGKDTPSGLPAKPGTLPK